MRYTSNVLKPETIFPRTIQTKTVHSDAGGGVTLIMILSASQGRNLVQA